MAPIEGMCCIEVGHLQEDRIFFMIRFVDLCKKEI